MAPCVVFLHIPRTGGTTLTQIAKRLYRPDQVLERAHERLAEMPPADLARLRFIGGHLVYGVAERLPQGHVYVTLLRDPVERAISVYQFARARPENRWHRMIVDEGLELADLIKRGVPFVADQ